MPSATFRFYEELNDFLPPGRRGNSFEHEWTGSPAVKDLIEALGVPHPEVEIILVNGESVDFAHRPLDGDRISVYPMFESLDVTPLRRLRPDALREPRFVLDVHLGRLAGHLRLLGFDAAWRAEAADAELARTSAAEQRVLLTRDRGLLKRSEVTRGLWIRSTDPDAQAREVLDRLDLRRAARPFTRCLACNGMLREAAAGDVHEELQPRTRAFYHEFRRCETCGQVYWKGSHYEALAARVRGFLVEKT